MATEAGGHCDDLPYPDWQRPVQEAILELNKEKLKDRVAAAEAAISERLQTISQSIAHRAERQAIENAVVTLRILKREIPRFTELGKQEKPASDSHA